MAMLVFGCWTGVGCSGQPGPGLLLRLAGFTPSGGCAPGGRVVPSTALAGTAGTIRLSVIRHDGSNASFLCDSTARLPDEHPNLDLGEAGNATFDVHIEFFDPDGHRVGTGALTGLSGADIAAGTLPVQLYRASALSCPQGPMKSSRAFHSATVLPNGEVLLYGGLAGLSEGLTQFVVEDSAEVFDPRAGQFMPVKGTVGRRAFHQAALLDLVGGMPRIVFYGGLGADAVVDGTSTGTSQFRLSWKGGSPAKVVIATYDPQARTLTPLADDDQPKVGAVAFSGAAPLPGGGLVAIGGESFSGDETNTPLMAKQGGVLFSSGQTNPKSFDLMDWLVAASVTLFPDDSALVIGTSRSQPGAIPAVEFKGLRLNALSTSATPSASFALDGVATAFHTAAWVHPMNSTDLSQVLVTGGFVLDPHGSVRALDAPAPAAAVRLYHVLASAGKAVTETTITPYGSDSCRGQPTRYRPAGFEAASRTFSGRRVLITGGTPRLDGSDCEAGDTGALCALSQVSIYDADSGQLSRPALGTDLCGLGVPRLGHQQVLLADGTILLTGGISHGNPAAVTPEAEVYNPRATDDTKDVDDPVVSLLMKEGLSRSGTTAARPCSLLQ